MTLTEFLLARIAEDEAVARSAEERARPPWRATYGRQVETRDDGYLVTPEDEHSYSTDPPDVVALHIARHDPARVLAECEAKRQIVELHPIYHGPRLLAVDSSRTDFACERCHATSAIDSESVIEALGWCETLRFLALPYAGHPEYRTEWSL